MTTSLGYTIARDSVRLLSAAGGSLAGTYPNPTIGPEVIGDSNINPEDPIGRDKLVPVQSSILVGSAGAPAFGTGFSNLGSGYKPLEYWLDEATEMVHLEGIVQSTSYVGTICTLPVGFRPIGHMQFAAVRYDGTASVLEVITVYSNGVVQGSTLAPSIVLSLSFQWRLGS